MDRTAYTETQCCAKVYFNFTYTSTPPMDRTACTEPQCLYNGAIYLYFTTIVYAVDRWPKRRYTAHGYSNEHRIFATRSINVSWDILHKKRSFPHTAVSGWPF